MATITASGGRQRWMKPSSASDGGRYSRSRVCANALTLVPIHMLIGFGIALSLWVLALLALLRGVRPGLAVLGLLWGVLMPALGLAQGGLVPGSAHWVIQSLHLLVGLGGIALAQALGSAVARSRPADPVIERQAGS